MSQTSLVVGSLPLSVFLICVTSLEASTPTKVEICQGEQKTIIFSDEDEQTVHGVKFFATSLEDELIKSITTAGKDDNRIVSFHRLNKDSTPGDCYGALLGFLTIRRLNVAEDGASYRVKVRIFIRDLSTGVDLWSPPAINVTASIEPPNLWIDAYEGDREKLAAKA